MIVALGVMTVMMLLAALAAQAATQGNGMSNADADAKHALQAAEAGLATATYRTNMLRPAAGRCVTDQVTDPEAGRCPQQGPEMLGNGAAFSYRVTPILDPGSGCAGMPVEGQQALSQRCITAIGTVDGVVRRVQARVAAYASTPLFPVAGILGLKSVDLSGNFEGTTVATNGTLTMSGNARSTGAVIGPAGKTRLTGNAASGPVAPRTNAQGPLVLAPVNPGSSATVNDNVRIAHGQETPPVSPFDQSAGSGLSYVAKTRTLTSNGNTTLTLGGGIYNFCSIDISGNFTLAVAPGAKAAIYVDSPDDPNSGCPAGSGTLSVSGNFDSGTHGSDPTTLQLYVYGTNDGENRLTIRGNSRLYASVYAPQSTVDIAGNSRVVGGVAAGAVIVRGNGYEWDERSGTLLQPGSQGLYYRTAWRQCSPQPPNPGDPQSGC